MISGSLLVSEAVQIVTHLGWGACSDMIGWLNGWMVGWLDGWLVGWSAPNNVSSSECCTNDNKQRFK
jgi:hypothetical protein